MKPILRASLQRELVGKGTGNALEVFSITCQADLGSRRTGAPRKTDLEMSTSLGMRLSNVESFIAERDWYRALGNGLEVFRSP